MIIDGHITLLPNADVGKIIANMDEAGIKRAVLSPADHEIAVNNFEGNSRVLKVVGKNPDRFYAYATSNPWFGKSSVETLKAAMKSGAVGLKINSSLQGFTLLDPVVYPLVEAVAEAGTFIYAHTGTPVNALPLQLRVLARRYPHVNFIMGRSGRTDFRTDAIPTLQTQKNIFADTAHDYPHTGLANTFNSVGSDQMIFCSDSPYETQKFGVECVKAMTISKDDKDAIFRRNLVGLLVGGGQL
jgi:uncharacterized protein